VRASSSRAHKANVICISGCRDSQTSSDVTANGESFGAMSNALSSGLWRHRGRLTWCQLLLETNRALAAYVQVAQLSSEQELNLDELIDW
jgi:hypothetical protein